MPRSRDRDDDSSHGVLLLVAGALAGAAAGIYLAQRFGGLSALTAWVGERLGAAAPRRAADPLAAGHRAAAHGSYEGLDEDVVRDDDDEAYDADDDDGFVSADEALEDRVLDAFSNDPILSGRAIDIGAINAATIELTGHVFAAAESERATTLARGVPGVTTVVNRLAIRADEQDEDAAAARYAAGDPRSTESHWEGSRAVPPLPLDDDWTDTGEALRDAADAIEGITSRRQSGGVADRGPQPPPA
jgi:hypothetical protein